MQYNGYPSYVIDCIVKRFFLGLYSVKKKQITDTGKKTIQIILPFLGSVSRKIEKTVKKVIQKNTPNIKIQVIYRATSRLGTLLRFKDSVPSYLASRVVYEYKCSRCNSTYTGKTRRHTKTRFAEHLGISPLTGKKVKVYNPSNVYLHNRTCEVTASFDDFTILCRDNSMSDLNLRTKESLYIHLRKPSINGQKQSIPLKLF